MGRYKTVRLLTMIATAGLTMIATAFVVSGSSSAQGPGTDNSPPVARDDAITVACGPNGGAAELKPLENDDDPDGDDLTISSVSGDFVVLPITATLIDGETISFVASEYGCDAARSFSYVVKDSFGSTDTGFINVTTTDPCTGGDYRQPGTRDVPPTCVYEIPDLTQQALEEAESLLNRALLPYELEPSCRQAVSATEELVVSAQTPGAGPFETPVSDLLVIKLNCEITVLPSLVVPDVVGLELQEAKDVVLASGHLPFDFGCRGPMFVPSDFPNLRRVSEQNPEPGVVLIRDNPTGVVDLTCIFYAIVPDFVGLPHTTAVERISHVPISPPVTPCGDPNSVVVAQDPASGTEWVLGESSPVQLECDLDSDGDGVTDGTDNCTSTPNSDQRDNDGDSTGDVCDDDDDNDGVPDSEDNCSLTANAGQRDRDGDGRGNACDQDADGDEVRDDIDNCVETPNPSQTDTDTDGRGDACDTDDDNDSVNDTNDNCPTTSNPSQTDTDTDGRGDACDNDDDNDSVNDTNDNCPLTPNADQTDEDGDGIGDACDSASGNLREIIRVCGEQFADANFVFGTAEDDLLSGTRGSDVIVGGSGNDTIRGRGGNDCILGGSGNDRIEGGAGADLLFGSAGKDRLTGGSGNDVLDGGSGRDRLAGSGGGDVLIGGDGPDLLKGGGGPDALFGGSGVDNLQGGRSNDRLDGGAGRDRLAGGQGTDSCGGATKSRTRSCELPLA